MIDKFYIRQHYHNVAVKITLADNSVLYGCIIKDKNDNCLFVKNLDLIEYNKTKNESLVITIEIRDIKNIDYQKP